MFGTYLGNYNHAIGYNNKIGIIKLDTFTPELGKPGDKLGDKPGDWTI